MWLTVEEVERERNKVERTSGFNNQWGFTFHILSHDLISHKVKIIAQKSLNQIASVNAV